jgi:hypothetical protein
MQQRNFGRINVHQPRCNLIFAIVDYNVHIRTDGFTLLIATRHEYDYYCIYTLPRFEDNLYIETRIRCVKFYHGDEQLGISAYDSIWYYFKSPIGMSRMSYWTKS